MQSFQVLDQTGKLIAGAAMHLGFLLQTFSLATLGSPDPKRVRDIWVFEMRLKKDTTPDLLIVGRLSEDGKRLAGKSAELDEQ